MNTHRSPCASIQLLGFEMAAATNSGSEAIDLAIRVARKWARQVKDIPAGEALILTASKNYHGRTMLPLSSSENASHTEGTKLTKTCVLAAH